MISKKDVQFYFSANFKNEATDAAASRKALISIAEELLRFQYETEESRENKNVTDNIFEKLDICSANMKTKNRQLNKVKGNLKIACTVAKIVMSAKDREMESLLNHLSTIRTESSNLIQRNKQYMNLIEKLREENIHISNEVERVRNIIHLGYQELQKIRHEIPRDIPYTAELKEILIACGQFYADYCNEHERRVQLEHRNKFLNTKISLLENNLAAAVRELRDMQNQNLRLARSLDGKNSGASPPEGETLCEHCGVTPMLVKNCSRPSTSKSQSDIKSHVSVLNSLLCDQKTMLKDLRKLSEELNVTKL